MVNVFQSNTVIKFTCQLVLKLVVYKVDILNYKHVDSMVFGLCIVDLIYGINWSALT